MTLRLTIQAFCFLRSWMHFSRQRKESRPADEENVSDTEARPTLPLRLERKCPLCMDHVEQPAITPCGHVYCWRCITQHVQRSTSIRTRGSACPVCTSAVHGPSIRAIHGNFWSYDETEMKSFWIDSGKHHRELLHCIECSTEKSHVADVSFIYYTWICRVGMYYSFSVV